jgi:diguanylate cyclase (GGDEF)-like protein
MSVQTPQHQQPTGRPNRILVVSMDEAERQRLIAVIKGSSHAGEFDILEARSAPESIVVFRSSHPDLIIISAEDIRRLGMDVCRQVRREEGQRHTGIVFVAQQAIGDEKLGVECLEIGADDFVKPGYSPAEFIARVRGVLRLKAMTDELRSANHKLRQLSLTDELTGLANMRCFNQKYAELIRMCRQGRHAMGVIMLDLDKFKSVNDTTNHLVGSHVISEAGRLIRVSGLFKDHEVAARYGGDEYIIACEAASPNELLGIGEAIRRMIANHTFEKDGFRLQITSSVGTAWVDRKFTGRAEDIIKAADLMLYRSKELGRNRVCTMALSYPVDLGNHLFNRDLIEEEMGDRSTMYRLVS